MTLRLLVLSSVFILTIVRAGEPGKLSIESADVRLRRAYALARETNDSRLVERVLERSDHVRRAFKRQDVAAAE